MKNRFYLACTRDNVGANMGFHAKDGCGYVTDIDKAHVYTKDEAQKTWNSGREFDIPVSADHVDRLTVYKVDCQHVPSESSFAKSPDTLYVSYVRWMFSGNDVYWHSYVAASGQSLDFSLAHKFKMEGKKSHPDLICIPFEIADAAKRRTFDHSKYNPRTMTQGAGIKMPKHVKREKRRKKNPKHRYNCEACGQLFWSDYAYEEKCVKCTRDKVWGFMDI